MHTWSVILENINSTIEQFEKKRNLEGFECSTLKTALLLSRHKNKS